jgi:hypothetical protein
MQRAIDLGLAAWGRTVDRPQPSEIGKCVWHEQKRSTLRLDGPGSQDAFTRGIALPDATPLPIHRGIRRSRSSRCRRVQAIRPRRVPYPSYQFVAVSDYRHSSEGSTVISAQRYATDWLTKAEFARSCNERNAPWPAWSTGDTLAVAVLLRDTATFATLDCTEGEALQRLRHDIGAPNLDAAARWFAKIRTRLDHK